MSPTTQLDQPVSATQPRQSVATPPILEIKNLHTHFFLEKGTVKAVNGVNLTLPRQSTLGVVGESGCGKSVTAMSVMRLVKWPPGKVVDGQILLHREDGKPPIDLVKLDPRGAQMRAIRGGDIDRIERLTELIFVLEFECGPDLGLDRGVDGILEPVCRLIHHALLWLKCQESVAVCQKARLTIMGLKPDGAIGV